jgi:CHASE1-domain containing sensor protein
MGGGGESLHIGRVPALRRMSGTFLTIAVLLAGLTLTWVAASAAIESEKQRTRAQLQLLAADTQSAIGDRLLAYEALLRAGVGLLDAFWPVSSENWQRFAAQMRFAKVYPGLQGIGFAARVEKTEQFAVVLLEPLDESNRLALGFDPASEPRRRAAMQRARDAGSAALSGKIVLVQDLRRGLHTAGFVLFLPVYSSPTLPAAVAERRETLRGFTYGAFRAEDFFRSTLAGPASTAFVEIFDGDSPSTDTLLYRTGASVPPGSMTETRRLPVADHVWTLRVSSAGMTLATANSPIAWIVLGGVSTTLLLAGLAQAVAVSRRRLQDRIRADLASNGTGRRRFCSVGPRTKLSAGA